MEDKAMQWIGRALLAVGLIFGAGAIAKGIGAFHGAMAAHAAGQVPSLALSKITPVATEAVGIAITGYGVKKAFGK